MFSGKSTDADESLNPVQNIFSVVKSGVPNEPLFKKKTRSSLF